MKKLFFIVLTLLSLLPVSAFAEIKTVTHTLKQPFGGSQSPDDARIAGIHKAKREALEQFGTYIESTTVVKNAQVDSDEILALTAGVTKAEVIKQKNYADGDAFGIEITVKVELDTAVVENGLKRLIEDRNQLKDLKNAREREKMLLARIEELEKENNQKGKTDQQADALKKSFQSTSQRLSATKLFEEAYYHWKDDEPSTLNLVIDYLSKAINLDPEYIPAYINRGTAFFRAKQINRAIIDYDQAIHLNPSFALTYLYRGMAYARLKQLDRAIADFDQAIHLNPSDIKVYYHRGSAYAELQKFDLVIENFEYVIRLDPNNPSAYYNMGLAHENLNQLDRAITDFNQSISIDKKYTLAYINRGTVYAKLKQYDLAILDFDKAISLEPNNIIAHNNRGFSFVMLNKPEKGCADFNKACELGACNSYVIAREEKTCK